MPPLDITGTNSTPPSRGSSSASCLPTVIAPNRTPIAAPALIITSSSPAATARHQPCSSSSSSPSSSSSSSAGSSPSSVTTITTIESHSSSTAVPENAAPSRDLIAEYLAAKSRSQQAPAIFKSKLAPTGPHDEQQQLALAYRHPTLLMDEEENVAFCSAASSVGNERNKEVEVKLIEDNSIELLDAKDDIGEGEQESLIVPKPKMMAFHSPKASPIRSGSIDEVEGKCRLVGRVNPNILKTWEQLSGGGGSEKNFCKHKRKNSLITVTSSENSAGDKQSCLIFYRNQFDGVEADGGPHEFQVMKIRHHGESSVISEDSTTIADLEQEDDGEEEEEDANGGRTVTISLATSTGTTTTVATTNTDTTSSEGCYDFYDSIDDSSNRRRVGRCVVDSEEEEDEDDEEEEYGMAAGEGLADFTSLDRKKLMWSIDVE